MSPIDIFKYHNYKTYLTHRLVSRGIKNRFAKSVGCLPSYLSQVLNRKPHLTLEQAIRANHFLLHSKTEAKYFVLLLEKEKSGTKAAKDFFDEQLAEMRDQRSNLKRRLVDTQDVHLQFQHRYYSTWYYIAIHLILMIPECQDIQLIADHFRLPYSVVAEAISFLESAELVVCKDGKYEHTKRRFF